ncbi:sulfotransferase domain-containing protein [Streptomyces sp. NPDC088350]|uniref:sulfotransferase domain-containing protein n=1 Tax=Streptomyces sp. NPDC088350 TaxID=3365854 RepID=UPI003814588F
MEAQLAAAGFGDITWPENLVLLGSYLRRHAVLDLPQELGLGPETTDELAGKLIQRGYLGPDGATDRGRRALLSTMVIVRADRWKALRFRPDDIVVSAQVKSGTTWLQMICALLVFQQPDLAAPLSVLSPWLDGPDDRRDDVLALLEGQQHRRFIKTHSPLSDITRSPQATYIAVGRHPLDAAISLYHQRANMLDRETGEARSSEHRDPPREWLLKWLQKETRPPVPPDSLAGMLRHMSSAWALRHERNVVLLHYDELAADLTGQMRYLAQRLDITVPETALPELVKAATFDQMRDAAGRIKPLGGVLADDSAFFRSGRSGSGTELLTDDELAGYYERAAQELPPDLLVWLHGRCSRCT